MRIWDKYLKCKEYAEKKRITQRTNEQWNFFNDKQWEGLESGGEILPFFNFIKPIVRYKVATVCGNNMTANYSDLMHRPEYDEAYRRFNESFIANWERANMDAKSWRAVKIAAIEGDSYTYFGDEKLKDIDILGETDVLFGDEQCQTLQDQPYIIVRERLDVKEIRRIAEENGIPEYEINAIQSDRENDYQVGNKDDVDEDSKATAIVYYERIDGIIHMARAVQTCEFVPLHPIKYTVGKDFAGQGLKFYPFVQFRWEDQPNDARGLSEVRTHIPNQIKENQVLAQRAITVAQTAYPKMAYDSTAVANPEALETIGGMIEVTSGGVQRVGDMVGYLNPATISNDSQQLANDLREVTRELAGASETTLGQIDPTRVAASAIEALKSSSAVNVSEQVSKFREYVEEVARLWLPLQITYTPSAATEKLGLIGLEEFERLEPDIRVDVAPDTPWSKEARQQTIDNLLEKNLITLDEYAQLVAENSPVPKTELLKICADRAQRNIEAQQMIEPIPQ
jgi:hypothetical protein